MADIDAKSIRSEINRRQDFILSWLKDLIRFPSENRFPEGNEKDAQKFVLEACRNEGWEVDYFSPEEIPGIEKHPSWLQGRKYENERKNVVAVWRGKGNGKKLLLSGHVDVAPFEPGNWEVTEPFSPIIKDGKLYGRGSADMKGGLAASFWALKILKDMGFQPAGDIIFESLVDEEFAGGNGTLASRLRGYNADLVLYTEPSGMKIAPGCLGAFLGDIIVKGAGGMPYTGYEIPNPLEGAAKVIQLFSEWKKYWNGVNEHPLFAGNNTKLDFVLWNLEVKEPDEFIQMGAPRLAKISWIVWGYPGLSEEMFYSEFHAFWNRHFQEDEILKKFEFEIVPDFHYVKPWEIASDAPEVQEVVDVFREFTGKDPEITGAPFSCDMAIYGEAGNPVIILGPRGDNLHAHDEWVLVEDILTLTGIFSQLITTWCS